MATTAPSPPPRAARAAELVADLCPQLAPALTRVRAAMIDAIAAHQRDVYEPLARFVARPGKVVRSALTLLFCDALGGDREAAIEHAAIIELIHAFTLIHDDIEDGGTVRRGAACLHREVGTDVAINLGDALYTIAWHRLAHLDGPPARHAAAARCYASALEHIVYGQALDLRGTPAPTPAQAEAEYVHMVVGKTGALLGLACEIGALLAGDAHRVRARRFGRALGVAFQVRDDILDVTGATQLLGKDTGLDAQAGRRSLPALYAREGDPRRALARAQQVAQRFATIARACLEELPLCRERRQLEHLTRFAIQRSR